MSQTDEARSCIICTMNHYGLVCSRYEVNKNEKYREFTRGFIKYKT